MGKKGVIMDNGKKAQSSMALYWQKNKTQSKHPKQKQPQEDEKQITDKSVMSNFQKWKMHKEKVISKAYVKPPKTNQQNEQKQAQKQRDDQYLMQKLMQSKKPKVITSIPGFGSKNNLANKLQIEKPKQADQSTNVLRLPSHMQDLTQQQIVQMLRQRKAKQQMQKRIQKHRNPQNKTTDDGDMMLGDDYINLKRKNEKEEEKEPIVEEQPKQAIPQPSYFKSDILNKIQKEGMEKVLVKDSGLNAKAEQGQNEALKEDKGIQTANKPAQTSQNGQKLQNEKETQPKKPFQINPKFLPRALKK